MKQEDASSSVIDMCMKVPMKIASLTWLPCPCGAFCLFHDMDSDMRSTCVTTVLELDIVQCCMLVYN